MKTVRKIIEIDEELCDGCGNCVPSCAEGALQIIDGKARVIADLYCDDWGPAWENAPKAPFKSLSARPTNSMKKPLKNIWPNKSPKNPSRKLRRFPADVRQPDSRVLLHRNPLRYYHPVRKPINRPLSRK